MDPWAIVNSTSIFLLLVQMFSCYGALHTSNLNEISGMLKTSLLIGRKGLHMCEKTISLAVIEAIRIFKVGFHMKKTVSKSQYV